MRDIINKAAPIRHVPFELTELRLLLPVLPPDLGVVQRPLPALQIVLILPHILVLLLVLEPALALFPALDEVPSVLADVGAQFALVAVELPVLECALVLEFGFLVLPGERALFHLAVLHLADELAFVCGEGELPVAVEGVVLELAGVGDGGGQVLATSIETIIQKIPNIVPIIPEPLEPLAIGLTILEPGLDNRLILIPDHSIPLWFSLLIELPNIYPTLKRLDLHVLYFDVDLG